MAEDQVRFSPLTYIKSLKNVSEKTELKPWYLPIIYSHIYSMYDIKCKIIGEISTCPVLSIIFQIR